MKIITTPFPKYLDIEIVEHKAIGHPDSICDGVAEAVSRALSKEYIKETGSIQHHNVDKVALVAGQSIAEWGGGTIMKPIRIIIAGRANPSISVATTAIKATREYVKTVLPLIKDEHLIIDPMIGKGSSELITTAENIVANDTSFGVAFAPFNHIEKTTLGIADFLTGKEIAREFPEAGRDIKVMSNTDGKEMDITVALAFVGKYLHGIDNYRESKEKLTELLRNKFEVQNLLINTLDKYDSKELLYLTVIGTSAEQGDDGATGRGNRINGLITPGRPMSLEAACGKNPVSHVGKIYNVVAQFIANRIYSDTGNAAEVMIQSRIGHPITQPPMVLIRSNATDVKSIVNEELGKLPEMTLGFLEGKFRLF
ncbi:MAG: hypothetical protein GOV01_01920 [Candidatus Altiarchaeota archaeon]|nr:hypothetical protein [Candidatus Altiarchaeota archaeon]